MSALTFSTGCAGIEDRLEAAGSRLGQAEAASAGLPALPTDCRRTERAGVLPGDDLTAALAKYDAALGRQNQRGLRCANWFDRAIHGEGIGQ